MLDIKKAMVFDIETDNLLPNLSKLWCFVGRDLQTNETIILKENITKNDVQNVFNQYDTLIGHNIIGFDLPALKKLFNIDFKGEIYDTYILSQLLYPNDTPKGHSLGAWGEIFRFPKGEHSDFSCFSNDMLEYCIRDVDITERLWKQCKAELDCWDWSKAYNLEKRVYQAHTKHQTHWYLDTKKLDWNINLLSRYIYKCEQFLLREAPLRIIHSGSHIPLYTKTGISSRAQKYADKIGRSIFDFGGDFTAIEFERINLKSNNQKVEWLLSLGWRPDTFNYKTDDQGRTVKDSFGEPIITSPKLAKSNFYGVPERIAEVLRRYNQSNHKLSALEGYKKHMFDGNKIPTPAQTCGTNTGRYTHSIVVNIPRVGSFFGKQMRSLFIAPEGLVLLGCDVDSLEARVEGSYTFKYDGGEYANFLINEPDIHAFNARSWGIDRNMAKTAGYALAYQCQPAKLQSILGCDDATAKRIHRGFWDDRPALSCLVEDLENTVIKRGFASKGKWGRISMNQQMKPWIKGIDGRKLYVREVHSIKNTLIQNAGAMAVKLAYVLLTDQIAEKKLKARVVMVYHDEFQILCKPEHVQDVKEIVEAAIPRAGELLGLKVPLSGSTKIGKNWAQCH